MKKRRRIKTVRPAIELVVFDFNGTIVADTQPSREADNEVIKAYGGTPPSLSRYQETLDIPFVAFYVKHGCDFEQLKTHPEMMGQVFHNYYEPRALKVRTRRGVRQMLAWLKRKSIPAIILSNYTQSGVEAQLKRLKLGRFFTAVLANKAGQTSFVEKNKLKRLADYLKKGGYDPARCLIVGDSPEEVEIGRQLGLKTVALKDGCYSEGRLKVAGGEGPHYPVIANVGHLRRIFKAMERELS